MSGAWTFAGESADLGRGGGGTVTLVDQSTFSLSEHSGDVSPGGALGVFAQDTRLISRWQLHVDGHPPEPLSAAVGPTSAAAFVLRVTLPDDGGHLAVLRRRQVNGGGIDETVELRSYTGHRVENDVTLVVDADL